MTQHNLKMGESWWTGLCIYGLFFAIFSILLGLILYQNHGQFIYTLDDPYIELTLAEKIAHGHYGINSNEYSAPASSIIWPFLLVPFVHESFFAWIPLVYNVILSCICIALILAIVKRALSKDLPKRQLFIVVIVTGFFVALNMFGLLFLGLEHTLQITVCLAIIFGAIRTLEDEKVPWWMIFALILAPLVRYELLAVSFAFLFFLFVMGYKKVAVITALAVITPVVGFSLYLKSLNLDWLPSSVLVKENELGMTLNIHTIVDKVRDTLHLFGSGSVAQFSLLLIGLILLFTSLSNQLSKGLRVLAGAAFLTVVGQFLFGHWGWFHRYEIYVFAITIPVICYIYGASLSNLLKTHSVLWGASLILLVTASIFLRYVSVLHEIPLASNNIYLQQFQMHRFVNEYYRKPVAVNDIGWVSFDDPNYVLDLWGLASGEARTYRKTYPKGWLTRILNHHQDVELAIIYEAWFKGEIPPEWHKVAVMSFDERKITPPFSSVSFYSTKQRATCAIFKALNQFKSTLPKEAHLNVLPEESCEKWSPGVGSR